MLGSNKLRFFYFDAKHAIGLHDWIIEYSGGLAGVKDAGQVGSILEHIQNDTYYPELENKLSHLVYSTIKSHAFNDGNKRSSIAFGAYFLELNGFDFLVKKFTHEMENIVVWVADNLISKELLFEIIVSILYEEEFAESLKLEILNAVNTEKPYKI